MKGVFTAVDWRNCLVRESSYCSTLSASIPISRRSIGVKI